MVGHKAAFLRQGLVCMAIHLPPVYHCLPIVPHHHSFTCALPLLIYLPSVTIHLPSLFHYSSTCPLPHLRSLYHYSSTSHSTIAHLPSFYHYSSTVPIPLLIYPPSTAAHLPALYRCLSTCPLPLFSNCTLLLLIVYLPSTTTHLPASATTDLPAFYYC